MQKAQAKPKFDQRSLDFEVERFDRNVEADVMNGKAGLVCVSVPFDATTANVKATVAEMNKPRELLAEQCALVSRTLLGLADPPAAKYARQLAALYIAKGINGTDTMRRF